jgi:hypothetical protein
MTGFMARIHARKEIGGKNNGPEKNHRRGETVDKY